MPGDSRSVVFRFSKSTYHRKWTVLQSVHYCSIKENILNITSGIRMFQLSLDSEGRRPEIWRGHLF